MYKEISIRLVLRYIFIALLYIGIVFTQDVYDSTLVLVAVSTSDNMLDSQSPVIESIYPFGGENFNPNEIITISWDANDQSFNDHSIDVSISYDLGENFSQICTFF